MLNEPKLGQLIQFDAARDAVHIAIAPVVAAEKLAPGQHVGFVEDSTELVESVRGAAEKDRRIGIVDPFLPSIVLPTERFYMFLYPRSITSLRHDWTHPAFAKENPPPAMGVSEIWLRAYALDKNCYDSPEKAFQDLLECLRTGEMFFHGSDLHCRYDLDHEHKLKEHAENHLGITIDFSQFTFSCSC